MAVLNVKAPTERKRGPYKPHRPCIRCKAHLLTTNPGPLCSPCELALPPERVEHLKQHADSLPSQEIELGVAA